MSLLVERSVYGMFVVNEFLVSCLGEFGLRNVRVEMSDGMVWICSEASGLLNSDVCGLICAWFRCICLE